MKRLLIKIAFTAGIFSIIAFNSGCDNKSHHGQDAFGGEDLQTGNGTQHHDKEHYTDNAPPLGDSTLMKSEIKEKE